MNSKPTNSKKVIGKYLSGLVAVLAISAFVVPQTSYAFFAPWEKILTAIEAAPERLCSPAQALFTDIAIDQPQQSIVRFGYNYDTVRFLKIFYNVFGVSPDNAVRCVTHNIPILSLACEAATGAPPEPAICDEVSIGL